MTQDEWRRRHDAQRLLNYQRAREAENAADPERMTMNIDGLGERVIVPASPDFAEQRAETINELSGVASEMTPEFLEEFAKVMARNMERRLDLDFQTMLLGGMTRIAIDPAGEPEGRPVTAREVRDRPSPPRPQWQGPPDPQAREVEIYLRRLGKVDPDANRFDRWFDIHDSEEELEKFLAKCCKWGQNFRVCGHTDVDDLEERLVFRRVTNG